MNGEQSSTTLRHLRKDLGYLRKFANEPLRGDQLTGTTFPTLGGIPQHGSDEDKQWEEKLGQQLIRCPNSKPEA